MSQAKEGDSVKVNYTGKLDDGTVFDSSEGKDPLEFTIGSGQVIPGFENAVDGMEVGDSKTVTLSSEDAYGPRRDEMVLQVERERLPDEIDPQVGQQLQVGSSEDQTMIVQITEVTDDSVTLDANHPLAGKDLTFEIELVEKG
ncbi:MAG: peptidylprolyl isomerase [Desulfuromonadales bacterium]|nr:peptidylprolyl isomerase [Desulfuromonadales bacterium]NIS40716.1 peptidylprolyl isomerase [Desulfuromonadales bacterium]